MSESDMYAPPYEKTPDALAALRRDVALYVFDHPDYREYAQKKLSGTTCPFCGAEGAGEIAFHARSVEAGRDGVFALITCPGQCSACGEAVQVNALITTDDVETCTGWPFKAHEVTP